MQKEQPQFESCLVLCFQAILKFIPVNIGINCLDPEQTHSMDSMDEISNVATIYIIINGCQVSREI